MRIHHNFLLIGILLFIGKIAYACLPDMNSVGIVLNNGEHVAYDKIESYGSLGVNYLREIIAPVAAVSDSFQQRSLAKKQTSSIFLLSQNFMYDPSASSTFSVKPMFTFDNDTLILNDYWALSEQPAYTCSLSVSNDTLYLSYAPVSGPVNDWTPSVETTLKIHINTSYKSLTVCFKAVPYARPAKEIGVRNATKDFYAFLSVPPFTTYKYRAHSDSSIMVYLGYEQLSFTYKLSPRITISSSDLSSNVSKSDLFAVLADELQWLSNMNICTLTPDLLNALSSKAPQSGGQCYWSKQDSFISLNQWFLINGQLLTSQSLLIYGPRSGCGLGTEFDLPASRLAASSSVSDGNSSYYSGATLMKASVKNGLLDVVSQIAFDNIRVVNPLGRMVFSYNLGKPSFRTIAPLSGKTGFILPGRNFIILGKQQKTIMCQSLFTAN
jgi:hypothetical protein